MGNVCSTGQPKKKGSVSEKSEESFDGEEGKQEIKTTEQNNSRSPVQLEEDDAVTLLVTDSEHQQQVSSGPDFIRNPSSQEGHGNEEKSKKKNLQPPNTIKDQQQSGNVESPQKTSSSTTTTIDDDDICTFLLHGKLLPSSSKQQRIRKIVIYILADSNESNSINDDRMEYKRYKRLLQSLHSELSMKCQSQGFEFLIVDLEESCSAATAGGNKVIQYSKSSPVSLMKGEGVGGGGELRPLWDIRHWSQYPREAQGGHQEMANRLNDLKRHHNEGCFIIPIVILGSVLGQAIPLLPLTIESQDFTNLLNIVQEEEEKILLEKWYTIDNSYQPLCHRLNPTLQTTFSTCSISMAEERSEELYRLFAILLKYFNDDLKDTYLTTVVEQEIRQIIFKDTELCKHCIWLQIGVHQGTPRQNNDERGERGGGGGGASDHHRWWRPLELERERRLTQLYQDLRLHLYEKNIIRLLPTMNLMDEDITDVLGDLLTASITRIIDTFPQTLLLPWNTNGWDRCLLQELETINRYTRSLLQNINVGVLHEPLNEIRHYLKDDSKSCQPLIIHGPPGCGKSVLLAKVAENLSKWCPDAHLILRFTHLSGRSSDLLNLLGSIVQQLCILIHGKQLSMSHDLRTYSTFIDRVLHQNITERKSSVILLIDAIDNVNNIPINQCWELETRNKDETSSVDKWSWLPSVLNRNSKIVLTMTTNLTEQQRDEEDSVLNSLLEHEIHSSSFLRLKQFPERLWQEAKTSTGDGWKDQGGGGGVGGGGATAGGYECLPMLTDEWLRITNSGDEVEDRTPFHAKALRWLQWMNASPGSRPRLSSDTTTTSVGRCNLQPEVLMLQFLLESSQFSTDHCEFLLLVLALSKWGIQEMDCLQIFQLLTKMEATTSYRVWSRFCWLLTPWLQSLDGHLSIRDRRLRDMILNKYQSKCYKIHKAIRDHYDRKEIFLNRDKNIYNLSKLANLPFHQFALIMQDNYKGPNAELAIDMLFNCFYFTDLQWIADKVEGLSGIHFLYDILAAEELVIASLSSNPIKSRNNVTYVMLNTTTTTNNDHHHDHHHQLTSKKKYLHIEFLKSFFNIYGNLLNYDGKQFLTLFKYHLRKSLSSDLIQCQMLDKLKSDERIRSWLESLHELEQPILDIVNMKFPIQTKECSPGEQEQEERKKEQEERPFSQEERKQEQNDGKEQQVRKEQNDGSKKKEEEEETIIINYDALHYLPHNGNFVASISNRRQEIAIWDALSCQRVRLLQGIPQPIAMCPFGQTDAAVLCRREIKIFNLDEGQLKVTLKGVMNQKMPYFGLHDQKHLVCLSRNRMYVNLMNLDSGDCVTTFKAGEDRFLNSLLVSGDGRILVCGDETQKPFPLLVWHLTQRKLLYDLRIPHHDFLTALSAITYEGSYVAVVTKELNEPTPNFIVVYDLQSGTLFKKWKPNTDTVALAISQLNACVIAGLADARIMVWDLVTGNCRWTLTGHTAPVTSLKLDPLGKVLLSTDKEGRDRALRLWELNTGKSLAVLKPDYRISAYEILPNGGHVILALDGQPELIFLTLRNYTSVGDAGQQDSDTVYFYGNRDNQEKIFNLNLL